jgi:hypothetical protein
MFIAIHVQSDYRGSNGVKEDGWGRRGPASSDTHQ